MIATPMSAIKAAEIHGANCMICQSLSGRRIEVPIDTICVHGDSAHSAAMVAKVRRHGEHLSAQGRSLRRSYWTRHIDDDDKFRSKDGAMSNLVR